MKLCVSWVWLVTQTPLADMHNAYRAKQKTTKGRIRYNLLQLLHQINVTDSSNKVRVQIIESRLQASIAS